MTKDEALRMALDALEYIENNYMSLPKVGIEAIKACKEALAQPEPKPIAFVTGTHAGYFVARPTDPAMVLPVNMALYTQPNKWQDLTDDEIDKTYETQVWDAKRSYARAIEAKLRSKNI